MKTKHSIETEKVVGGFHTVVYFEVDDVKAKFAFGTKKRPIFSSYRKMVEAKHYFTNENSIDRENRKKVIENKT